MIINHNVKNAITKFSKKYKVNNKSIIDFMVKVHWEKLSADKTLIKNKSFLKFFSDDIHWDIFLAKHKLSMKFIEEFIDIFERYIDELIKTQQLTEEILDKYYNKYFCYSCYKLTKHQLLSEDFLRRHFSDYHNGELWENICKFQILSEAFIREFADRVDWLSVSVFQTLSEPFIREFKDKVDWHCIFEHQNVSNEFMEEFADKVNIVNVIFPDGHQELISSNVDENYIKIDGQIDNDVCSYTNENQIISEVSADGKTVWIEFEKESKTEFAIDNEAIPIRVQFEAVEQ